MVTDVIGGMARIPGQLISIFSGNQPMKGHDRTQVREWAVSHFAESLSKEEKRKHREASENPASERGASLEFHEPVGEQPEGQNNQSRDSRGGNSADTTSKGSPHVMGNNYQLSGQERPLMQQGAAKPARSKKVFIETGHYTGMIAIKLLDLVLVLPADFTLSLTKGFHNAPKLYHDSTVREIPTVRSIRSGFRAAGSVFIHVQNSFGSCDLLTFPRNSPRSSMMELLVLSCSLSTLSGDQVAGA